MAWRSRIVTLSALLCGCGLVGAACSSSQEPGADAGSDASPSVSALPDLMSAVTTAESTIVPKTARRPPSEGPNPAEPEALQSYMDRGFASYERAPGWAFTTHTLDDSTPPAAVSTRKRLLRFVHLPDLQIADDESPSRITSLDSPTGSNAALRPQDMHLCRMTNAAVRTIRYFHAIDPFAFLLLGGDNSDNAQTNEVQWALDTLDGAGYIKCDSGQDDDPVPGPNNDGKDAFASRGLGFPFYWVTGNHDVLVQGNLRVDEQQRAITVGSVAGGGTRDYSLPGAPARTGDFVVPDARRELLSRRALMEAIRSHGDGHGIGDAQVQSGKANYAFDPPGTPFRVIALDLAHETGGADGVLTRRDLDSSIKPMLDAAKAEGKWVLLTAHYSSASLTRDGGIFGVIEPDALLEREWLAFLGDYPNVVASFVGHTHMHQVRKLDTGAFKLWEVMSSALADYPNQFRIIEIYDENDEWLSIHATCADFSTEGDEVAEEGRRRSVVDWVSGWMSDGLGVEDQRNVVLWVKKP